jgi:hypothetical protein
VTAAVFLNGTDGDKWAGPGVGGYSPSTAHTNTKRLRGGSKAIEWFGFWIIDIRNFISPQLIGVFARARYLDDFMETLDINMNNLTWTATREDTTVISQRGGQAFREYVWLRLCV